MATYSTIKGFTVQSLSSDPEISQFDAGVWTAGGTLNTGKENMGTFGTVPAAMGAGGRPGYQATCETYDGASWTEVNDLNTNRFGMGGAGTTTAGIVYGGESPPSGNTADSEEWDGTSWTEGNNLNTARLYIGSFGTQTAAVAATGNPTPTNADSEEYDGTSWTTGNSCNDGRYGVANKGSGTLTDGLITGGTSTSTESYDGTSWTEESDSTILGFGGGAGSAGNAAIAWCYETSNIVQTWNGSAWSTVTNYPASVFNMGGCGTQEAALSIGGGPGGVTTSFEWSAPSTVSVAVEGQVWYNSTSNVLKGFGQQGTGAWASDASMNTQRGDLTGTGLSTAALCFGGYNSGAPPVNGLMTESYDGTAWAEVNDLNNVSWTTKGGQGTQTAALKPGENTDKVATEEFDGTSWAAGGDLGTPRSYGGGAGTQTAGLMVSGDTGPPTTYTTSSEEYDGTSWTAGGAVNTGRNYFVGGGTQTAAIIVTGKPGSTTAAEEYDGSSWTTVTACNTSRHDGYGSTNGTQTSFLNMTGTVPGVTAVVEEYNGSTWTEIADVTTARQGGGGAGNTLGAMVCGGGNPATTATEIFAVPTAIKTFTAS